MEQKGKTSNKKSDFKSKNKKTDRRVTYKGKNDSELDYSNKCGVLEQDWTFYAENDNSATDMASFTWNEVVGTKVPSTLNTKVPGILVLPVNHCVPYQDGVRYTSLTRSANVFYQYFTQGFTTGVDFEAPDLLMTAIAGSSLAGVLEEGRRAYGMLKLNTAANMYYPRGVIEALGFDYDDLKSNAANFRAEFNIRAAQFNEIVAVPKDFAYLKQFMFYLPNLFTDTSAPAYSTAIAYKTNAALKYSGTAASTGTSLVWKSVFGTNPLQHSNATLTVSDYFEIVDELLDALTGDDPRNMFSALRRVYGSDQFFKVGPIDINYETQIYNHDVVKLQVHNCTPIFKITGNAGDPVVTQDTAGNILCEIKTAGQFGGGAAAVNVFAPNEYLLDSYDQGTGPREVLDITVAMQAINVLGSEAFVHPRDYIYLTPYVSVQNDDYTFTTVDVNPYVYATNSGASDADLAAIDLLTKIDSCPLIRIVVSGTIVSGVDYLQTKRVIGEIDRYTGISLDALIKLHERCAFTLFKLPINSRSTTR